MGMERTLVLIKPDAMVKRLAGNVISEIYTTELKMLGLKLVNVQRELAEKHYEEHRGKPFFEKLVKHLTGEFHNDENVMAIVYEGDNAIQKIRDLAGKTHPQEANPTSLRGKYGRVHSETNCFENVIHASDSIKNPQKKNTTLFN